MIWTKLDLTCIYFWRYLWTASNLCDDLFSVCSNLCVYWFIVIATYVHNNFYFVSTYMYECMLDFVYSDLICVATHCIVNSGFWQLLFKCLTTFIFVIICIQTYVYDNLLFFTTYVYDILYLWQLMYMTDVTNSNL